ncbi:MAG: 3'(2'),5'-bisphosphate nucleotidase CysQ [Polyangiaceae bacterium]
MKDLLDAAEVALDAALEASALVRRVYKEGFDVEYKAADDPVTRADRQSNALLCERLGHAFPGVPIVAEESPPSSYSGFETAEAAWFVDPVDGTREFVAGNGEFAVMIGLAQLGRAVLSVIVAPSWDRAFVGVVGSGAWEIARDRSRRPVHVSDRTSLAGASVVVSRSRQHPRVPTLLASMGAGAPVVHGSSGLKAVLVATGAHDVYLQPGIAGMRWDACASDALVRAAGGECTDQQGRHFEYASGELLNASGLVATNGLLHVAVVEALRAL